MRRRLTLAFVLAAVAAPARAQPAFDQRRLIAPASPGGGWDQAARVMQQVLLRVGIARTVPVENIAGHGRYHRPRPFRPRRARQSQDPHRLQPHHAGGHRHSQSPVTLHDVTPIGRITGEYEVADAVGVAPTRVNDIAFSGGGEAMSAILGGQVSVGINGLAEFPAQIDAGTVRVLGISSAARLPGLDAPTLRVQGVDVELENWRSLVAPTGINAADRERLDEGGRGDGPFA